MANELILIVEDNPKNLKLVRDILQVKGYQTVEAETGEEGVRPARERHPGLILMDIRLSGMSDIEALGPLRADATTRTMSSLSRHRSWRRTVRGLWRPASMAFRASPSA
jgi:CheY-like chemotaxis protein